METKFESVHYLTLQGEGNSQRAGFAFAVHGDGEVTIFTLDPSVRSFRAQDRVSKATMDVESAREVYIECLRQGAVKSTLGASLGNGYGGFSVSGEGLASLEHAEAWRERYYQSYHPAGYGTRVEFDELGDGMVVFRYSRANSCD